MHNFNFDDLRQQQSTIQYPSILTDELFEHIFTQLNEKGFAIIDELYPVSQLDYIRNECIINLQRFRQAEIQNGRIDDIRSDHILWIDDHLPLAQQHSACLLHIAEQLNRAFYFGIYEVEAHFAHYHAGEFYKLHRDNPHNKNGRVISTVFYLHQDWQDGHGGELRLQDKHNEWHIIQPKPNRLAIFQSDLLHEVLLSHQDRYSITAWLRQRATL